MTYPNYYQMMNNLPNMEWKNYQQPNYSFQPQSNNTPQRQTENQQLIFVNGLDGAQSYPAPLNSSVILMDNFGNSFFIKTTDAAGLFSIKKYDFQEVEIQKPIENSKENEEIAALSQKIDLLIKSLSEKEIKNERPQTVSNKLPTINGNAKTIQSV